MLCLPRNMAKTLFFIEALALALLAIVFPLIAEELATAFILPLVISLVLPLAGAAAIWPLKSLLYSLRAAFSPRRIGTEAEDFVRILHSLGAFSRAAAVLGFLTAFTAIGRGLPLSGGAWILVGAFLSAYALLNAELWRILAAVVSTERSSVTEHNSVTERSPAERGARFAARYGLSPREWETASHIAAGLSYKEAAYELGISIKTVKVHMSRVYEKTGSGSNVGLVLLLGSEGRDTTKVQ
jgi:DNA-binding CsgD family transcriptional regulator